MFLSLLAVACLLAVVSSCKKCYTCVYGGVSTYIYCEKNTPKSELDHLDTSCMHSGGIWSVYNK
jgi:hypothetical protein